MKGTFKTRVYIPRVVRTPATQITASKYILQWKEPGSLEKWPNLGLEQGRWKTVLAPAALLESRKVLRRIKGAGGVSKEHRYPSERTANGQSWNNFSPQNKSQ